MGVIRSSLKRLEDAPMQGEEGAPEPGGTASRIGPRSQREKFAGDAA